MSPHHLRYPVPASWNKIGNGSSDDGNVVVGRKLRIIKYFTRDIAKYCKSHGSKAVRCSCVADVEGSRAALGRFFLDQCSLSLFSTTLHTTPQKHVHDDAPSNVCSMF